MASGVKRSLFSKPAWAATAPATSSKTRPDEPIFGRNNVYEDILVAEQRRREKKVAKGKDRSEGENTEAREAKRRRVSVDAEGSPEHDWDSDSDVQSISSGLDEEKLLEPFAVRPVTRSTPTKNKDLRTGLETLPKASNSPRRRTPEKSSVHLDSDPEAEDDDMVIITPPKPTKTSPPKPKPKPQVDGSEDESEEEDDFLRELKRKAREKAKLQNSGKFDDTKTQTSTSASENPPSPKAAGMPSAAQARPGSSHAILQGQRERSASEKVKEPVDDPEVKILITSVIPDTQPLIVKRKASQPLKQVREFWCQRNDLDAKTTAQVFFTWRGTRLFDSTTMRGPIQKLKNDHVTKHRQQHQQTSFDDDDEQSESDPEVEDPSQGRITIEATTLELFEEQQREKERRMQASHEHGGDGADVDDDDEYYREQEAARERAQKEAEEKLKNTIVVRLVSQTVEPMNLRVRPHTSIGKMMQGFAATRGLDEGKTAWLVFDGERLEPESTVEEVGLENEDEVEVHIR